MARTIAKCSGTLCRDTRMESEDSSLHTSYAEKGHLLQQGSTGVTLRGWPTSAPAAHGPIRRRAGRPRAGVGHVCPALPGMAVHSRYVKHPRKLNASVGPRSSLGVVGIAGVGSVKKVGYGRSSSPRGRTRVSEACPSSSQRRSSSL